MNREPTSRQIDEAKEYIRQRISAEMSMKNHLMDYMEEAARKIIAVSYKYSISPKQFRFSANKNLEREVNAIIEWLKQQIEDTMTTLAVADHKDEDNAIIPFITGERYGKTFRERLAIYCNRYKYEIEAAIAAGLLLNIAKDKLAESIRSSFPSPYNNAYIVKSIKERGLIATRLRTGGVSYGVGKTNSMFTALDKLTENAVAAGWMKWYADEMRRNGAIGFYVMRGSSWPCQICDDMVGYHEDSYDLPLYHLNCHCIVIPIII